MLYICCEVYLQDFRCKSFAPRAEACARCEKTIPQSLNATCQPALAQRANPHDSNREGICASPSRLGCSPGGIHLECGIITTPATTGSAARCSLHRGSHWKGVRIYVITALKHGLSAIAHTHDLHAWHQWRLREASIDAAIDLQVAFSHSCRNGFATHHSANIKVSRGVHVIQQWHQAEQSHRIVEQLANAFLPLIPTPK